MTNKINYYGTDDNYIHLKFGDALKHYHFTPEFIKENPEFSREYKKYWDGEKSEFKNPFQIVRYAYANYIPVNFYYNFTDTPATDEQEIIDYLRDEGEASISIKK